MKNQKIKNQIERLKNRLKFNEGMGNVGMVSALKSQIKKREEKLNEQF